MLYRNSQREQTREFKIAGDDLFLNLQQETVTNLDCADPLSRVRIDLVTGLISSVPQAHISQPQPAFERRLPKIDLRQGVDSRDGLRQIMSVQKRSLRVHRS